MPSESDYYEVPEIGTPEMGSWLRSGRRKADEADQRRLEAEIHEAVERLRQLMAEQEA